MIRRPIFCVRRRFAMSSGEWKPFLTVEVKGKPPYFDSGTDPKAMAHEQYPLVSALERAALAVAREETKATLEEGTDIRIEIDYRRKDYESARRVDAARIAGGVISVLTGVLYYSARDVREVSYREEPIGEDAVTGYTVRVFSR